MDKDAFTKDETFNKIVPTNHNEIVEIVPNVGRVEDSNNNNRTLEVTVAPLSTNLSWTQNISQASKIQLIITTRQCRFPPLEVRRIQMLLRLSVVCVLNLKQE